MTEIADKPKKKRGRPPKQKPVESEEKVDEEVATEEPLEKKVVDETTEPQEETADKEPEEANVGIKYNDISTYPRDEYGLIDWKQLIPPSEIVLNEDACAKRGVNVRGMSEEEVKEFQSECDESLLLVKLEGFKKVARLRGLVSRPLVVHESSSNRCVVSQTLNFCANTEDPSGLSSTAVANATVENVNGVNFQKFLEPIAQNRAFVRAVKDALGIKILGQDELPVNETQITIAKEDSPKIGAAIQQLMNQHNVSWETLKNGLMKKREEYPDAENWNGVKDIPEHLALVILKKLKGQLSK